MRLSHDDIQDIIRHADKLVLSNGYTKIFVKVPASARDIFESHGYCVEATVPFFFAGRETALFMAKYQDPFRKSVDNLSAINENLVKARAIAGTGKNPAVALPSGFVLTSAQPGDADQLAGLYRHVFESYPFPVFDPDFIRKTMKEHVRYFCVRTGSRLVAASSCEVNEEDNNAEMTDFATDPDCRGKGLAGALLHGMERALRENGIHLSYTIARAVSYPVNALFSRAGYTFAGMLPNNTNICGSLECMNVWYKKM